MNGRMMKRLVCFLIAAMLCVGTVCECGAATQVTDLRNFKIESSGVPWATYRKIAQRLHLKRSYSSAFDVSYRNANIIVGFARHPSVYGKKRYYSYALNRGSKKLRFYGVILGDTLSTVKRKLRNTPYYYKGSTRYWGPGDYAMFKTSFRNGRLASWAFYCAPTS